MSPPLDSQEFTDRAGDRPLRLLADRRGVHAVALDGGETGASYDQVYALRPDRLDETRPWLPSLLHRVPRGPAPGFTAERALAWGLSRALLDRAGLRGGAEGGAEEDEWPLKTGDPATQARIRRRSFGLLAAAQRITNGLLARVLETADPAALTLARRFPLDHRWRIYAQSARPALRRAGGELSRARRGGRPGHRPSRGRGGTAAGAGRRALEGGGARPGPAPAPAQDQARGDRPPLAGGGLPQAARQVGARLPARAPGRSAALAGRPGRRPRVRRGLYAVWVARNLRQMAAGSLVEVEALVQDLGDWAEASQ